MPDRPGNDASSPASATEPDPSTGTTPDPSTAASGAQTAADGQADGQPDDSTTSSGQADDAQADAQADASSDDDRSGNREAARRRRELRDARAELDEQRQVVERFQRRDAEAFARQFLADPADLWRDGLELAEVIGSDGLVDEAALQRSLDALLQAHPHWRAPEPVADPRRAGLTGRSAPTETREGSGKRALQKTFRDLLGAV